MLSFEESPAAEDDDAALLLLVKVSFEAALRADMPNVEEEVERCFMDSDWASIATWRRGQRSMFMPFR